MRQTNIKNINSIPECKLYPFQVAIIEHMKKMGKIIITVNKK